MVDGFGCTAQAPERASARAFALAAARGPEPPPATDVIDRIAVQGRRFPDKTAIVGADRQLTYGALAADVAALANRLCELGVTPGSLVAVSMSRGADELTTMLAVLTAGAAYVPLDPSQPQDRLSMILQDARPVLMIAKRGHRMPGGVPDVRTVFLDDERPRLARYAGAPGAVEIDSSATAYVLFTSGSTGRPKGVEISRGAMSNLLASTARSPGQRESDVLLAVSTTMFDIAVLEQFGPLYAGATVHIADSATARDGRLLRALLEREPITVMQATPTTWRMLVDAGWHGDDRLRMLVGGEALTPELARRLLPHGELWNMYGPTETTVWSAIKRIDDADDITIGRPIDHTQLYVLRDGDRLAPRCHG